MHSTQLPAQIQTISQLQEIDDKLVQLLGDRISLLAQNPSLSVETPPEQILAGASVPDFVWRSLHTSCMAAARTPGQTPSQTRPKKITLIGGSGQMGQFFARQLIQAGHFVSTLGRQDWAQAEQLLTNVDLVLICVPTAQVEMVVRRAVRYLSPGCAIADLTSTKSSEVAAMLSYHVGPVLGLHPMFGPGTQSFLSQNVVVCQGRYPNAFSWLLDLMSASGACLSSCSPDDHDTTMATVQAMRYFSALGVGVFLSQEKSDIAQSLALASPLYRLMLNQVSRLLGQKPTLCLEIMLNSGDCRDTITRLAQTYGHLARLVAAGQTAALQEVFEAASSTFASENNRALSESNYVIESLSVFLRAQQ